MQLASSAENVPVDTDSWYRFMRFEYQDMQSFNRSKIKDTSNDRQ